MKTRTLLATMLFVMATVTVKAQPMSYYAMRDNARFLTDRMAYTLGLTERLIDDLYMINYDYIYAVNDYLDDIAYGYHYDEYMAILAARDAAIRLLLTPYQWTRFITYDYFYRPIFFQNARWWFGVYDYYPRSTRFYFGVPRHYRNYHGGHYFAAMRPVRGHVGPGHGFGPHAGRIGDGFRGNDRMHNGNHGNVRGNNNNRGYHFDTNRGGNNRNNGGNRNDNMRNDRNHNGNHNNGGYNGSYNNGGNNGNVHGGNNPGMNRGGSGSNGAVRGGSRSNFNSGSNTRTTVVNEPRTIEVRNSVGTSSRSSMGASTRNSSVRTISSGRGSSRPSSSFGSASSSSRASSASRSVSPSHSSRSVSTGGGSRGGSASVSRGGGRH